MFTNGNQKDLQCPNSYASMQFKLPLMNTRQPMKNKEFVSEKDTKTPRKVSEALKTKLASVGENPIEVRMLPENNADENYKTVRVRYIERPAKQEVVKVRYIERPAKQEVVKVRLIKGEVE